MRNLFLSCDMKNVSNSEIKPPFHLPSATVCCQDLSNFCLIGTHVYFKLTKILTQSQVILWFYHIFFFFPSLVMWTESVFWISWAHFTIMPLKLLGLLYKIQGNVSSKYPNFCSPLFPIQHRQVGFNPGYKLINMEKLLVEFSWILSSYRSKKISDVTNSNCYLLLLN